MDMTGASSLLRLLGDDARLRLLRVLSLEALNVSELTSILGIAQSGVSRHLGLLRDAGLVAEERSGGYTWYRLAPDVSAATGPLSDLWTWLQRQFAGAGPEAAADDARLQEVRRLRKESFAHHGIDSRQGQIVPGRSWAAWSRALGFLLPPLDVADLGCGDGYLSIEAAAWARRVVAVDRSADVLKRGRELATRRRAKNIEWKKGDLERLPLPDASVDVALLSQALHHAADPAAAVREAFRILRPSGRLLVLDLRTHGEEWVRTTLGDRWLGFSEDELRQLCLAAGFDPVAVRVGARIPGDPFVVLIAGATRPATATKSRRVSAATTRTSR
jgi:ArsR family transcriptional regulator